LPAKYAYRSKLDVEDVISDVFYDVGRVSLIVKMSMCLMSTQIRGRALIPSLEQLCIAPLNDSRAIILINRCTFLPSVFCSDLVFSLPLKPVVQEEAVEEKKPKKPVVILFSFLRAYLDSNYS
jgi:hypothetical protein